jgi:hypothetical protein
MLLFGFIKKGFRKNQSRVTANWEFHTKAPRRAETEPPPGAGDLAATFITNSLTVCVARAPSDEGKQYSMIRSLRKSKIEMPIFVFFTALRPCEN